MNPIEVKNLGLISYDDGMAIMEDLHAKRVDNKVANTLLVLQHESVITKGRRMHGQSVPNQAKLEAAGIQVREADRGGLLTYHGPGQIVVYFVVRFADCFTSITDMVRSIEATLQKFLLKHGIETRIDPEHPGIWVGDKKIASIGLRVSQGVTKHGIALNICNDMSVYKLFDPCGMTGNTMTNLEEVLGAKIKKDSLLSMQEQLAEVFCQELQAN
jgi:lipoate-protein ligase B